MTKQPMADRVAAHNAGQYDAELPITIPTFDCCTRGESWGSYGVMEDEGRHGSWVRVEDAKKLAAQVAILSDMLGECEHALENAKATLAQHRDIPLIKVDRALEDARIVLEMSK